MGMELSKPEFYFYLLLQASERNLCILLNTLAAMLLESPEALSSPASPKHKGKGKKKAAAGALQPSSRLLAAHFELHAENLRLKPKEGWYFWAWALLA